MEIDKTKFPKDRTGPCTICGGRTAYNTPKLRSDNGDIVCDRCGDEGREEIQDVVLIGIEQWTVNGEYQFETDRTVYQLNRNIIWVKPDGSYESMWTNGGMRAFRLRDSEKDMDLLEVFNLMSIVAYDGRYRCSGCNRDFVGEPAGYPLFVGIACPLCWAKNRENAEQERKSGHVCSMCRQPYMDCCC